MPFDPVSTVCHWETCGQRKAEPQKVQPASNDRAASPVAQELVLAIRALNANVIALDGTIKALLARLNQRPQPGTTEKPNGSSEAAEVDAPRTFINDHGLEVSDEDVPF